MLVENYELDLMVNVIYRYHIYFPSKQVLKSLRAACFYTIMPS